MGLVLIRLLYFKLILVNKGCPYAPRVELKVNLATGGRDDCIAFICDFIRLPISCVANAVKPSKIKPTGSTPSVAASPSSTSFPTFAIFFNFEASCRAFSLLLTPLSTCSASDSAELAFFKSWAALADSPACCSDCVANVCKFFSASLAL